MTQDQISKQLDKYLQESIINTYSHPSKGPDGKWYIEIKREENNPYRISDQEMEEFLEKLKKIKEKKDRDDGLDGIIVS